MTDAITAAPTEADTEIPPHALLFDLATRAFAARCLQVIAALGVADALGPDGADVAALAKELDLDADALGRTRRLLAANGVFDVALPLVCHNDASLALRSESAWV